MTDRRKRVLVVDDENSVLFTYRMILEQQGHDVTAASAAGQAIASLDRDFDLVLCDYSLDEQRTGFEVIEAARARNPKVPAALLTGYATMETVEKARSMDVAVLFKPIDIQEFLNTTTALLRKTHEPSETHSRQESGQKSEGPGNQVGVPDRRRTARARKG